MRCYLRHDSPIFRGTFNKATESSKLVTLWSELIAIESMTLSSSLPKRKKEQNTHVSFWLPTPQEKESPGIINRQLHSVDEVPVAYAIQYVSVTNYETNSVDS